MYFLTKILSVFLLYISFAHSGDNNYQNEIEIIEKRIPKRIYTFAFVFDGENKIIEHLIEEGANIYVIKEILESDQNKEKIPNFIKELIDENVSIDDICKDLFLSLNENIIPGDTVVTDDFIKEIRRPGGFILIEPRKIDIRFEFRSSEKIRVEMKQFTKIADLVKMIWEWEIIEKEMNDLIEYRKNKGEIVIIDSMALVFYGKDLIGMKPSELYYHFYAKLPKTFNNRINVLFRVKKEN